jgi:hypothetical protein
MSASRAASGSASIPTDAGEARTGSVCWADAAASVPAASVPAASVPAASNAGMNTAE